MRAALVSTILVLAAASACSGDDDDSGAGGASGSAAEAGKGGGNAGDRGSGSGGKSGSGGSAGTSGGKAGSGGASGKGGTAGTAGQASAGKGGSSSAGSGGAGQPANPDELPVIGGCTIFGADDAWNRDISDLDVDQDWTDRIHQLVGDVKLHPDYGNSGSEHYGIPINVVPQNQAKVSVMIDWYPEESDPGPYPFPPPADVKIEGGTPDACDGDCHLLVVQQGACMLYEGYACSYDGGWHCGGEATWDLKRNSYGQREEGWTSADAAGLAITPGLVRWGEVAAGELRHAIRFTVKCTTDRHIAPASHDAVPDGCDANDPDAPPMGLRVRLRADYDLSALSEPARVVARAMQRYGMILADNGSNFYFQGDDDPGWTEEQVEPLKSIPASAFEVVATPGL